MVNLSQRRHQHKLSFMYNVNVGLVPLYILDLIPPIVNEISDYPLRNSRNISLPYNMTNISQNHVYFHPLDYGMALKMILKTYQL